MSLPAQVRTVLVNARKWAIAHATLLKLLDSKSAKPADVDKAKKALAMSAGELFKAVQEFEKFLRKPPQKSSSIDWGSVFGLIAKGAGMLEEVAATARGPKGAPRINRTIDTVGEEVPE
jgi:hypothetical protein